MSTLQGNWVCKALADVHKTQPFRRVQGPSGILTEELYVKEEFVEQRDKYRCLQTNAPEGISVTQFFSPRFKVYVEEAQ